MLGKDDSSRGMFFLNKWYPEKEMLRIITDSEFEDRYPDVDYEELQESIDCRSWEEKRENFMQIMEDSI